MTAVAAAAIGGLAISGYELYSSEKQKSDAKKLAKNNVLPPQYMPEEVKQATQLAQQNYTNGMPGQRAATAQIGKNAATAQTFASKGASSGGDILDAANKINYVTQDATQQLALQAASYKSNALGGYEAALNNQANWQDKLYQNNQLQPYLRTANQASAELGAGNINEANALNGAVTSIDAGAQGYANNQYKSKLLATYGQGGNITAAQLAAASMFSSNQAMNTTALMGQQQIYNT